jgi:hypothetical protein
VTKGAVVGFRRRVAGFDQALLTAQHPEERSAVDHEPRQAHLAAVDQHGSGRQVAVDETGRMQFAERLGQTAGEGGDDGLGHGAGMVGQPGLKGQACRRLQPKASAAARTTASTRSAARGAVACSRRPRASKSSKAAA